MEKCPQKAFLKYFINLLTKNKIMDHTRIGIKPSTECELQIFSWRYKILQQHFVDVATIKILLSLRTADETGFSVVFEKV